MATKGSTLVGLAAEVIKIGAAGAVVSRVTVDELNAATGEALPARSDTELAATLIPTVPSEHEATLTL